MAIHQIPMSGVTGMPYLDFHAKALPTLFSLARLSSVHYSITYQRAPTFLRLVSLLPCLPLVLGSTCDFKGITHAKPITHKTTVHNSCARATDLKTRPIIFHLSQSPVLTRHSSRSLTSQSPKSVRSHAPQVYTMPRARRAWVCAS